MAKKKTPPRGFDELEAEMCRMVSMSCTPSVPCPVVGTILDEDQTVRWNREEVNRLINEYQRKAKDLVNVKNQWRDRLERELYERMVLELDNRITTKGAARIFAQAYEDGHSYGVDEVFIYLHRYMEMFNDVLKED